MTYLSTGSSNLRKERQKRAEQERGEDYQLINKEIPHPELETSYGPLGLEHFKQIVIEREDGRIAVNESALYRVLNPAGLFNPGLNYGTLFDLLKQSGREGLEEEKRTLGRRKRRSAGLGEKPEREKEFLEQRINSYHQVYHKIKKRANKEGIINDQPLWQELEKTILEVLEEVCAEPGFLSSFHHQLKNPLSSRLCLRYQKMSQEEVLFGLSTSPLKDLPEYLISHFRTKVINSALDELSQKTNQVEVLREIDYYQHCFRELRNLLALFNKPLIVLAMRSEGVRSSNQDLQQEGFIHLLTKIIPAHDYHSYKISSFACPSLRRFFRQKVFGEDSPLIRIPAHLIIKNKRLFAWVSEQKNISGTIPSKKEIAEHFGWKKEQVEKLYNLVNLLKPLYLNQKVFSENDSAEVGDLVSSHLPLADEVLEQEFFEEIREGFCSKLDSVEKIIFREYLCSSQDEKPSLREMQEIITHQTGVKISHEWIRKKGLRLKRRLSSRLKIFFNN